MYNRVESVISPGSRLLVCPEVLVVIGANTGGPQALAQLLPRFPAKLCATVIVVQQMRFGFTRVLADQLSSLCQLPAYEPSDGQALQASTILIAPSGHRVMVERTQASAPGFEVSVEDVRNDAENYPRRISQAMDSAAQSFGNRAIGVVLTGLGDDGLDGMRAIMQAGGTTIAQDLATSVVHEMPSRAIDAGVATETLPLWNIADRILDLVTGEVNACAA